MIIWNQRQYKLFLGQWMYAKNLYWPKNLLISFDNPYTPRQRERVIDNFHTYLKFIFFFFFGQAVYYVTIRVMFGASWSKWVWQNRSHNKCSHYLLLNATVWIACTSTHEIARKKNKSKSAKKQQATPTICLLQSIKNTAYTEEIM